MEAMRYSLLKKISVIALAMLLAACATTASKERQVRDHEVVTNRVAAGMQYLQLGQLNEARQHFSRALERDSNSAIAHNAMALLYRYEGDPANEEKHYRQALRADRNYTVARNNYGILLYERGDYDGASKEFYRAANDPAYGNRGGAFANLARSYAKLGQREEAEEAFQRALRLGQAEEVIQPELIELYLKDGDVHSAQLLLQKYKESRVGQMNIPKTLWLGIQVAAAQHNTSQQAEYEARLYEYYADSPEYKLWQQWRAHQ